MIPNLNSLIDIYRLLHSDDCLCNIKNESEKMGDLIGKFKFDKIKNHTDYLKINSLSIMKIKRVRKPLLDSDFEQIKIFNEELKIKYPNKSWINNLHRKENWINEVLILIRNESKSLIGQIEIIVGYDNYEKNRLNFDHRIVNDFTFENLYNFKDSKDDNKNWSEKIPCTCLKDIKDNSPIPNLFNKGQKYLYRRKIDGQICVYPYEFELSYLFENDSFYEYFSSPDSRDRRLNQILNE